MNGEYTTVFAKLTVLLSDGDGLRSALQWKGASSTKPCFRHWNIVKPGSTLDKHHHGGTYVPSHCSDPSRFRVLGEADLHTLIDVVAEAKQQWCRGEMTKSQCTDTQRCLGFTASSDGLLADPQLRSLVNFMDVLRYDWAHTFLANSMLGNDLWALIEVAEEHNLFSQKDIEQFLQESWVSPCSDNRVKGVVTWPKLSVIFSDCGGAKANEDAKTIKAGMSELLGLYRVLMHFLATRVSSGGPLDTHVHLFQLVGKAVDLLLAVKHRCLAPREAGRKLELVLQQHMELLHNLGEARLRPKLHWAFDVAECLAKDDFLVDAFTLERLHLRVKDVANLRHNLQDYETSVMHAVTTRHLNQMTGAEAWASPCKFIGQECALPGSPNIMLAEKAKHYGETFSVGNFACRGCSSRVVVGGLVGSRVNVLGPPERLLELRIVAIQWRPKWWVVGWVCRLGGVPRA